LKHNIGYFAGIDSGGTKCEIVICNDEKKILFKKTFPGIHYSVSGAEDYSDTVTGYLNESIKRCRLNRDYLKGLCLGVAGARQSKDRKKLKLLFKKKSGINNFLVTTDAMTALYGAFEGGEGIILICGTGSVLYGYSRTAGRIGIIRVGGWGRIIGDEGSGYWIGKRALNLITKEFDLKKDHKSLSLLSKELMKEFGINSENVNEKIFRNEIKLQELAPPVIKSAEKNCKLGMKIVAEAVDHLTGLIKTYLKLSDRKTPIEIAFIGSIIENRNILSETLKKEILKFKIVNVTKKRHAPSFGAVLLAMDNPEFISNLN